jgi:hypothetical protein
VNARVRILLVLLVTAFSAPAFAQSFVDDLVNPKAKGFNAGQRLWDERGFPRGQRNAPGRDSIGYWRTGMSLEVPVVYGGETHGHPTDLVRDEVERARNPKPDPAAEGAQKSLGPRTTLFATPSYEYMRLSGDRGRLPGRLVSTGIGLIGVHAFDRQLNSYNQIARMGAYANYSLKSDMDRVRFSTGQITAAVFMMLPAGESWTLAPGLAYVSDSSVASLEGVPLPFLQVVYSPSEKFTLGFGAPFNGLQWKPIDEFHLQAIAFGLTRGQVAIGHTFNHELFKIREYLGSSGEVFNLTEPRYAKGTRLLTEQFVAGVEGTWKPAAMIAMSVKYEFQFEGRLQTFDEHRIFADIHTRPGHALALSVSLEY